MADQAHSPTDRTGWADDAATFRDVTDQLAAYFAGELTEFNVDLDLAGTEFQRRVWGALCQIPYGETWSYSQLAGKIGSSRACRAVGLANGRNPVAIIVPCHRVIGANGSLVGYGGGLDRKALLLDHERTVRSAAARRHGAQPRFPLSNHCAKLKAWSALRFTILPAAVLRCSGSRRPIISAAWTTRS